MKNKKFLLEFPRDLMKGSFSLSSGLPAPINKKAKENSKKICQNIYQKFKNLRECCMFC
jgi:hypothetical protein